MQTATVKPYAEQTAGERLASLDKLQNVLLHTDWRELYLRLSEEADEMQRQMDNAVNWEAFVAARAVRLYLRTRVLNLAELVAGEKADLEAEIARGDAPPDYEID